MAKAKKPKPKFYAVRVGFNGPDIFTSWTEVSTYVVSEVTSLTSIAVREASTYASGVYMYHC